MRLWIGSVEGADLEEAVEEAPVEGEEEEGEEEGKERSQYVAAPFHSHVVEREEDFVRTVRNGGCREAGGR